MSTIRPFHLAIPVDDLLAARTFYAGLLGCDEGRSDTRWVDFDFFGHQLVCHLDERAAGVEKLHAAVDGEQVPVPHFGVVLSMAAWQGLSDRLRAARVDFVIEPNLRFKGKPGEQATLFLTDPAGNALEFKAFADDRQIFAT